MAGVVGGRRRLVVVSYHYPPDGAVGGLRWAGLTKYLGRRGWESWVVTAASPLSRPEAGVTVIPVARSRTLNDWWVDRVGSRRRPPASGGPAVDPGPAGTPGPAFRVLLRWREELGALLSVPDHARGWVLRAARRARRLIAEVQPDVVVSSGPPHSAHVAAWLATRMTPARWFIDLRDPWAAPIGEAWRDHPHFRSLISRWLNHTLERLTIRSAGSVICNTRHLSDALRERYPGLRTWWVPNGVDFEALPGDRLEPFPGLALAHVGTIYAGRDLTPLLQGLSRFLELHPDDAVPGPTLRVAGSIEAKGLAALRAASASLGLERRIELLGQLPRDEALRLALRSRLVVVLAQHQYWQVPAKVYEMVALGVPTLVLAEPGSASAEEARRIGAVAVDPEDIEGIAQTLARARRGELRAALSRGAVDYDAVAPRMAAVLWGELESGPTGAQVEAARQVADLRGG